MQNEAKDWTFFGMLHPYIETEENFWRHRRQDPSGGRMLREDQWILGNMTQSPADKELVGTAYYAEEPIIFLQSSVPQCCATYAMTRRLHRYNDLRIRAGQFHSKSSLDLVYDLEYYQNRMYECWWQVQWMERYSMNFRRHHLSNANARSCGVAGTADLPGISPNIIFIQCLLLLPLRINLNQLRDVIINHADKHIVMLDSRCHRNVDSIPLCPSKHQNLWDRCRRRTLNGQPIN